MSQEKDKFEVEKGKFIWKYEKFHIILKRGESIACIRV